MRENCKILTGDVVEELSLMEADSFDGCLTDPPYGLTQGKRGGTGQASENLNSPAGRSRATTGFMGLKWDGCVPGVEVWSEVLRVLKPGAHLLAFGGTRTHHRLMCAIEDAGFEIRDAICWVFASGFPKSLNVSAAIDKAAGAEREVIGPATYTRGKSGQSYSETRKVSYDYPPQPLTAPSTSTAKLFAGYGTALKPAFEIIVMAMKPIDGTYAENALKNGVAGINVDGSRVGDTKNIPASASSTGNKIYGKGLGSLGTGANGSGFDPNLGRWPANVIHDGSDEVVSMFPTALGQIAMASTNTDERKTQNTYGAMLRGSNGTEPRLDSGSAARFFYTAKPSPSERGKSNTHPCVKPVKLTEYLAKLILPPQRATPRRLLVPFSGSGSEIRGAVIAGWDEVVGIEREAKYAEISEKRVSASLDIQDALF